MDKLDKERQRIHSGLDAFIEYAEKTQKFADVAFYNRIKQYIEKLEVQVENRS